jgi:hypothetical protein
MMEEFRIVDDQQGEKQRQSGEEKVHTNLRF